MKNSHLKPAGRAVRLSIFSLLAALLLAGTTFWGIPKVEANHPVLVEGNCDSPVPGTTLVAPGTCGDFDGDGRIGTAEDTDGADRIFGTLRAALGTGTGAASGTGANFNGKIIIVTSGRFYELLYIGNPPPNGGGAGTANPGNVTIEAAPGVEANLDAVFQGDPTSGNNARQDRPGIIINYLPAFSDRVVTLRNLTIRNYLVGVDILSSSRVNIDNCRFENNARSNIRVRDGSMVVVTNSQVQSAGFRIGTLPAPGEPGDGIQVSSVAKLRVADTTISHNKGAGINNEAPAANVVLFKVSTYFNTPDFVGSVTIAPDPNHSF
ncbi:MAG TPA: right-handed parallel beta-helix repeat-containing protein [Pyrinomonadaceae bacterium]|nr:right-handed parallel beta-helix repeat-containing protein [Pyrinomonadaceae bacterium]